MRLRNYTTAEIDVSVWAGRIDALSSVLFSELLAHLLYYRQGQEDSTLLDLFSKVVDKDPSVVTQLLRHMLKGQALLEPKTVTLENSIMKRSIKEIFECTMWLIAARFEVVIASPELTGPDYEIGVLSQISKDRIPLLELEGDLKIGRPSILPSYVYPDKQPVPMDQTDSPNQPDPYEPDVPTGQTDNTHQTEQNEPTEFPTGHTDSTHHMNQADHDGSDGPTGQT